MPIYQYKCRECGGISEHRVMTQSEKKPLSCTSCGSQNIDRIFSAPNISTGRSEPSGNTCCGRAERCSDEGHCCGH